MSFPYPVQTTYTGMWRDASRDQLPAGSVWNLQDYIPNLLGAPLRKRGGWVYGSPVLANNAVDRMINAEFSAGAQLLAVDNQNPCVLWTISTTASAASAGALTAGRTGAPFFHANRVVFPSPDGVVAAQSYTGGAPGALAGSPPAGMYGTVYKDRSILASTTALPKRIYFSGAGDPTTWDTTTGWIDVSRVPTGVAPLRNAILVFSDGGTERIRGSTPPPGTDMVLEKVSDYGCIDHRSIALWNDRCIYADTNGIYITDGASSLDLTEAGGMSQYWRSLLATYLTSWYLAGETYRNFYIIVVVAGAAFQDCLVCYLPTRTWFRMQNFNFRCFAKTKGAFQNLFAGMNDAGRVARVTDIFAPGATNATDADGDAVLPVVEYPMAKGFVRVQRRWLPSHGLVRWHRMFLGYDVRNGGATPTLTMSYVKTPEATAYTSLPYTVPASTAYARAGRSFGAAGARGGITSPMLGVKIAQTAASTDTRLYALEAEYQTMEQDFLAQ